MGNRSSSLCCKNTRKARERLESTNTALEEIRAAQEKYFNTSIESHLDDSDDNESRDDSVDVFFGSDMSLDTLDDSNRTSPYHNCNNNSQNTNVCENTNVSSGICGAACASNTRASNENLHQGATSEVNSVNNAISSGGLLHDLLVNGVVGKQLQQTAGIAGDIVVTSKKKVPKRKPKAKFIRLNKRDNFFSILNLEDKKARSVDPRMYDYPFENLVFEGGGNKGLAYCGAVRLLEELGVWPQIKRLSGTSAGAMTAALLAVGYNSFDLENFFSLNLNKIFLDHKFGYLSLLPNLLTSYGWNPGRKIYNWFGQKMQEKTGDPDITFRQLYLRSGRELCIVVTNLNQMTSLYCHPKTTPDMPVRLAVRMSISIPGMFQAVKHTLHGLTDVFVDGGVLCNYPIHCFDGWWLSMKSDDNFLERLQPLEDIPRLLERTERFGTYNEKTLGIQLYSDNEQDLLKYQLENLRHGTQLQELPNTKLAREKIKKKKLQLKTDREHRRLVKAMNAFLYTLRKHNKNKDENIDREELEAALNDRVSFSYRKRLVLFGDVESDVILEYLDRDHNGKISFDELVHFMEETGISMQNRFLGYQRRSIKTFPMFLDTLQATLLTNVKRVYVEERDLKRTVGINTGHVGTSDFVLEPEDIEFVIERGRRSLEAFLKYYVASHNLEKKPSYQKVSKHAQQDSEGTLSSSNNSSAELISQPLSDSAHFPQSANNTIFHEKNRGQPEYHQVCFIGKNQSCNEQSTSRKIRSHSSGRSVSISDKVKVIDDLNHSFEDEDDDNENCDENNVISCDSDDDIGNENIDDIGNDYNGDTFEELDSEKLMDECNGCNNGLIKTKESSVQGGEDHISGLSFEMKELSDRKGSCTVPLLHVNDGCNEN